MTGAAASRRSRLTAPAHAATLPRRWPWLFRLFRWYACRYAARHLHAVRVSKAGPLPPAITGPVVIVLNHPSWWDPLLCFVLSQRLPDRIHWGPMEQGGLRQYSFLARVGMFSVETGTTRGALQFLRTARAILADPKAVLWITAQGRFADARERPPRLRAGVGHLAQSLERGLIVPMAVEMTFWDERTAEALVRFGCALDVAGHGERTADDWTAAVEQALEQTQDALAAEAVRRDPGLFDAIVNGRAGVGGVYDWWRRLRARMRGDRFSPDHSPSGGSQA
jgi:1-acyl-sn-glycerol-3-phosphate acyltransferase